MSTEEQINRAFTYHPPKDGQAELYNMLRTAMGEVAKLIDQHCPVSREKSTALTKLEECNMWANAAIARNG